MVDPAALPAQSCECLCTSTQIYTLATTDFHSKMAQEFLHASIHFRFLLTPKFEGKYKQLLLL